MASPTPKRSRKPAPAPEPPPEDIDPRWLVRTLAIVVAAAVVLAYASLCLLISIGSWQILLHPSPKVDRTPAALSIPFDPVRFDAAATGNPRLSAWWIPAATTSAPTILFLHGGEGSLSNWLDQLALLHRAQVNIFAIDYRGFGASDTAHPDEARMAEDAAAALNYLVDTRHISPARIVPYGVGLGAVFATNLVRANAELPALVIDNPDPGAYARALADKRSQLIPMRLLLSDRFDLAPLSGIMRPRLLLTGGPGDTGTQPITQTPGYFESLPDPKLMVTLPSPKAIDPLCQKCTDPALCERCPDPAYITSIKRFMDLYVPAGIGVLVPKPQ